MLLGDVNMSSFSSALLSSDNSPSSCSDSEFFVMIAFLSSSSVFTICSNETSCFSSSSTT
eukprot:UN22609